MPTRKLDHPFRERRAPEVSIKPPSHLRRSSKFSPKVYAPLAFIRTQLPTQIRLGQQLCRSQRIVNSFTRHRISETSRVTEQRPFLTGHSPPIPRLRRQARNPRSVTLGSGFEMTANLSRAGIVFINLPELHFRAFALEVITDHELPEQIVERLMLEGILRCGNTKRDVVRAWKSPRVTNPA